MARGRPVIGVDLIDRIEGPRVLRRRVRIILATLTGTLPIAQACAELGVGRTRFHALRWQVLAGAMEALKPQARGRPRRPGPDAEIVALQTRIRELEIALRTTALRSEIALTMPYLLDRAGRKKKGAAPRRGRKAAS
jgi:hypothetical protein